MTGPVRATLAALLDVLVPADSEPSALGAGVLDRLDALIADQLAELGESGDDALNELQEGELGEAMARQRGCQSPSNDGDGDGSSGEETAGQGGSGEKTETEEEDEDEDETGS